jgi:transposase-like protein
MARKRFSPKQIISVLRDAEVFLNQAIPVAEVCRKLGVSVPTYYRWRKEYGEIGDDQVRRLIIYLEESINKKMTWVVFEPNDVPLWSRVRRSIFQFLNNEWRKGTLAGATPEEAFFIKCDRTTMTQDDLDNGRLICVIGVAPVKPAEFVIFRIAQRTAGAES